MTSEDSKRLFLREELRKHNSKLADAAHNAGVITPLDYAVFQNYGYRGLYNGLTAKGIHKKTGHKKGQDILDHMAVQNSQPIYSGPLKRKKRIIKSNYSNTSPQGARYTD